MVNDFRMTCSENVELADSRGSAKSAAGYLQTELGLKLTSLGHSGSMLDVKRHV